MQAVTKITFFIVVLAFCMVFAQGSFLSEILPKPPPQEAPPAAPVAPAAAKTAVAKALTYEDFLEGIRASANSIMPEKEKFDSQVAVEKARNPASRDEYESSADYEKRIVNFEKQKLKKILSLEREYLAKTRDAMEKIKANLSTKDDIKPDLTGILEKNTDINGYRDRMDNLTRKTSEMKNNISQVSDLLDNLNFPKNELNTLIKQWRQKNILYISRLKRAQELMKDYIVQEQAKVLTTPRKKFEMTLGAYNADKGEFEFSMNDVNSKTVPFEYSGIIKIANNQAREMNRKTDDLTASIDYINYPLVADSYRLYPGVIKAQVFYKEKEVPTSGSFKVVQNLSGIKGFMEWAIYTDSLITGKLRPKNLNPSYVTSTENTFESDKSKLKNKIRRK